MGFLGDFVGGAADAGAGIIGNQIKLDQEQEAKTSLAKVNSDLETARQITVEKTRQQLQLENAPVLAKVENDAKMAAEQSRAGKLKDATQGILDRAVEDNANKAYGNTGDKRITVNDMLDEEKSQFAPTDAQRSMAIRQAGLETGQLSAKDVVADDTRNDIAMGRVNQAMDKSILMQQHYAALDAARNATSAAQADLYKAKAEELRKLIDNPQSATGEKVATRLSQVNSTINSMLSNGEARIDSATGAATGPSASSLKAAMVERDALLSDLSALRKPAAQTPTIAPSRASQFKVIR
jgi:hypothetical protein